MCSQHVRFVPIADIQEAIDGIAPRRVGNCVRRVAGDPYCKTSVMTDDTN